MAAEPSRQDLDLGTVLTALSDPLRRRVVRDLAVSKDSPPESHPGMARAMRGHHFRVLRGAGLIRHVDDGERRTAQLRHEDIDARFPGLLDLLRKEG